MARPASKPDHLRLQRKPKVYPDSMPRPAGSIENMSMACAKMESGTNSKKSSVAKRHSVCHPVALEEDKPDVGEHLYKIPPILWTQIYWFGQIIDISLQALLPRRPLSESL